jgi:hypothetical protein
MTSSRRGERLPVILIRSRHESFNFSPVYVAIFWRGRASWAISFLVIPADYARTLESGMQHLGSHGRGSEVSAYRQPVIRHSTEVAQALG